MGYVNENGFEWCVKFCILEFWDEIVTCVDLGGAGEENCRFVITMIVCWKNKEGIFFKKNRIKKKNRKFVRRGYIWKCR